MFVVHCDTVRFITAVLLKPYTFLNSFECRPLNCPFPSGQDVDAALSIIDLSQQYCMENQDETQGIPMITADVNCSVQNE